MEQRTNKIQQPILLRREYGIRTADAVRGIKDDGTDYQAYWGTKIQCITRGEHGYYYLTPEEPLYLMYWDDDTQESIKLCAKADCNHDNAACNAYFGDVRYYDRTAQAAEYASGFQIYYYNGFLYLLGTEGNLIQVSPDGSERKELPKSMTMTERQYKAGIL